MVHAVLHQIVQAVRSLRLQPDGIIQLAYSGKGSAVKIFLDAFGVGKDAVILQDRRKIIPIPIHTAPQRGIVRDHRFTGATGIEKRTVADW